MTTAILIAIMAGLLGMFGWGLADFFAKKTIDKVGDVQSLGLSNLFGMAALFAVLLFQSLQTGVAIQIPSTGSQWVGLAFFGALNAAVYLFLYRGFSKGNVSLLSPVFATFSGIAALLSILVFKEIVGGYVLLGLAVTFVGILVINSDRDTFRFSKKLLTIVPGFKEVAAATLMAALWTIYWDQFIGGQSWLSYTFFMYSLMTVAVFSYAFIRKIPMKIKDSSMWKYIALIGFTEVVAYAGLSWGYSLTTNTSIIAVLSGASALPAIILAAIFLKERITKIQLIGVIITILGIMFISLFN
jgi:drug/metabolite transporter (DMT)-like permease